MANFNTHLLVATAASGVASIATLATHLSTPSQSSIYFGLGVIGGLLPDIDSDHSIPIKILFNFIALGAAFLTVHMLIDHYSIVKLSLFWAAIYAAIRFGLFEAFTRLTVHRGIFHSLLATLFFTFITANISYHLLHYNAQISWISGYFIGFGYLVHLTLDELFSVNLINIRMKKSFGTALKPISFNNPLTSLSMAVSTAGLWFITPAASGINSKVAQLIF